MFNRIYERKRPRVRHRRGWENAIKMDLRYTGCADVDCIHAAYDSDKSHALANVVINFRISQKADNFLLDERLLHLKEESVTLSQKTSD
jgi:hypothetical protein